MPNFKRSGAKSLTCVINVNASAENEWLTKEALLSFAKTLEGIKNQEGRSLFFSISFSNGFRQSEYQKIKKAFARLNAFIEVGLEAESTKLSSLFRETPKTNHTTLVCKEKPNWLTLFFLAKANRATCPVTILQYVPVDSAERIIDQYRMYSKKFPNLEFVLHPCEDDLESYEGNYLMDMIKEEGYFEPNDISKFEFGKPEKVVIDYKYSNVELSPREIKLRSLNHFKGYECQAGIEHISVTENGEVLPSACGYLPRLADTLSDYSRNHERFECPADSCSKSDDILITKLESSPETKPSPIP